MPEGSQTRDCPGCGAAAGEFHQRGCGQERCPSCRDALMYCGCDAPDGDRLPWAGMLAGEQECRALGWFAREVPEAGRRVACGATEPGAVPDLTRFAGQYRWGRRQKRYVPRDAPLR
jgi:hypothetical protein